MQISILKFKIAVLYDKKDTSILNTGTSYLNTDYCILII